MAATVESAFVLIDRASGPIRSIRRELRELQADAEKAGRSLDDLAGPRMAVQMENQAREMKNLGNEAEGVAGDADKAGASVDKFTKKVENLGTRASGTSKRINELDKTIGKVSKWGTIASAIGVVTEAVGALGGGVIALIPRVTQLLGAGAAWGNVMVGAGAAMGVVKLATSGLSEAMQGNKKALASLTPDARAFVAELKSMNPEIEKLRESAQRGLFGGLDTLLAQVKRDAPQLQAIIGQTSQRLGGLATWTAGQIAQPGFMKDLASLVSGGSSALIQSAKGAFMFGQGLEQILIAAQPLTNWLGQMIDKEAKLFEAHEKLERKNGELAKTFDHTKAAIKQFADIGKNAIDGLKGVLHAATGESDHLWSSIDKSARRFDTWANSASGQGGMKKWFASLTPEFHEMGKAIGAITKLLADLGGGQGGLDTTLHVFTIMAGGADKLVKALGPVGKLLGAVFVTSLALHRLGVFKVLMKANAASKALSSAGSGGSAVDKAMGLAGVVGYSGEPLKAGALENPIAVLVVDKSGTPVSKVPGGGGAASTAARDVTTAEDAGGGVGVGSVLSKSKTLLADTGAKLIKGGTIAIAGSVAAAVLPSILQAVGVNKKTAGDAGHVAGDAAVGAGFGSFGGPIGTAFGAGAGALYGLASLHSIPKPELNAGAAAGVATQATSSLARTGGQPGSFQTAQQLAQITTAAQHLTGGLNALPVSKLTLMQKDAQALAKDPALATVKGQLLAVGNMATQQLSQRAGPAFNQLAQASKSSATQVGGSSKSIATAMTNSVSAVAGGISTINSQLQKALQSLGAAAGAAGAAADPANLFGGGGSGGGGKKAAPKHATGGRIPGAARGDYTPVMSRGGALLGMADGGELIVNQHTERDVNRDLMMAGKPPLGARVQGETRKHYATGGRVPNGGAVTGDALVRTIAPILLGAGGANKIGAAGVLGNAYGESTWNPAATDGNGNGGLWGFTAGDLSLSTLQAYAASRGKPWTDAVTQTQFLISRPEYRSSIGPANQAQNPTSAADVFMTDFERPGIPRSSVREQGARMAYALMRGLKAGAGGMLVPNLKAPQLGLPGSIGAVGQAAVNSVTKAANAKLQKAAAAAEAAEGGGGGAGVPVFPVHPGPVPAKVQRAKEAAMAIVNRHVPYGHDGAGWGLGAYDCSSFESTVFDVAGIPPWGPGIYYTAAEPINEHTEPGPGKWITVGTWGTSGQDAHTMFEIDGQYFESGGQDGGPHIDSGWSQKFDQYRHPKGFALGGRVNHGKSPQATHSSGNPGIGHAGYQPTQAEADMMQHNRTMGKVPVQWGGWNAAGLDTVVKRPTVFGAGEKGPERITITPHGRGGGAAVHIAAGAVQVNATGDQKRIQRYVDKRLRQFAEEVAAEIEAGAEEPAGSVID